jgi:ankyrin repeat protein
MFASFAGNSALVEELLKHSSADIEVYDVKGETALLKAASAGHSHVVELLVNRKANVMVEDRINGMSALSWTASHGPSPLVSFLLEHKANVNARNHTGQTPIILAASKMVSYAVTQPTSGPITFVGSDFRKPTEVVKAPEARELKDSGEAGIESSDQPTMAEPMPAAYLAGWRVSERNASGPTSVVKCLARAGAIVDARNYDGYTALMVAASQGYSSVVLALLELRASIDIQAEKGQTALMLAAGGGHASIVDELLGARADVTAFDEKGHTALLKAAIAGHAFIVQSLLTAKAEVGVKDTLHGNSALAWACVQSCAAVVKALLTAAADPCALNHQGLGPLALALLKPKQHYVHTVSMLLAARAEPNSADLTGRTPLMLAARHAALEAVEQLLHHRADPCRRALDHTSALDLALKAADPATVTALVAAGAALSEGSPTPGGLADAVATGIKMRADIGPVPGPTRAPSSSGSEAARPVSDSRRAELELPSPAFAGLPLHSEQAKLQPLSQTIAEQVLGARDSADPGSNWEAVRPRLWTEEHVGCWLSALGLGELRDAWRAQLVNGPLLLQLSPELLKAPELCVRGPLHQLRLVTEIARLTAQEAASDWAPEVPLSAVPRPSRAPRAVSGDGQFGYTEISFDEIALMAPIGRGHFGRVFQASWRRSVVVVKIGHQWAPDEWARLSPEAQQRALQLFHYECATMQRVCRHPHLVSFIGACNVLPHMWIVTQFEPGGSVEQALVVSRAHVSLSRVLGMCVDASAGVCQLHDEGIIHRDLATRNLLLSATGEVKVCDFGLSRGGGDDNKHSYSSTTEGPVAWMAPESLQNGVYSRPSDVFMFGVCLWEMLARQRPYAALGLSTWQVASAVCRQQRLLTQPAGCPADLWTLIEQCWSHEPSLRPSMGRVHECLLTCHARALTEESESANATLPPLDSPLAHQFTPGDLHLRLPSLDGPEFAPIELGPAYALT